MQQMTLTIDRLMIDENNARKHRGKDSIASMKASILALGVIQPLVVRPRGENYVVFAGGRRMMAIGELIADADLPASYPIPVVVKDADDTVAEEISLAENIIRRAMRPVDEFKAFARLADEGMTADEIALRFGQTVSFVRGRMALGKLHPDILTSLDEEQISMEAAMAYTIEPDRERQIEVFNTLQGWQRENARTIKEALTGNGLRAGSPLAKFIGETRYIVAGGKITADLFSDESYWVDAGIVEELKQKRIDEIKAELLADGWSFVKTADEVTGNLWEMRRHSPDAKDLSEEDAARFDEVSTALESFGDMDEGCLDDEARAKLEALEAEYEALSAKATGTYSAALKARTGVVIRTDHTYALEYGFEERSGKSSNDAGEKVEADPLKLSAPVMSELGKAATNALAAAVEAQPQKALAMLAALLELAPTSAWQHHRPGRISITAPGVTAGNAIQGGTAARSFGAAFAEYAAMEPEELTKALARMTAAAVDISQEWLSSNPNMRRVTLEAFAVDPTPHFDVESFFSSSKKPIIAAAYKEITGQDLKDGKKADMVAFTVDVAKKTGWLPEYLRTASYKLTKPKKSK